MNACFTIIRKFLTLTILVMIVGVSAYTDQMFEVGTQSTNTAFAKGNVSLETTQLRNEIELLNISGTTGGVQVAAEAAQSFLSDLLTKEFLLDRIAYQAAQMALTRMVNSITEWVNSGFEGTPAFVQDLQAELTDIMDEVVGDYIIDEILGGDTFVCSPFRLDVAAALQSSYARARSGRPNSSSCSVSTMFGNFEEFIEGNFSEGGWDNFIRISAEPAFTPYGSLLTAEADLRIRLVNAAGREREILSWGGGFLSSRVCTNTAAGQQCVISTPGTVINEQLGRALGTNFDALVAADEWNELVGALFSQLVNQAVTGANGLLGLSSGTSYSYAPYAGGAVASAASSTLETTLASFNIIEIRDRELAMFALASAEAVRLTSVLPATAPTNAGQRRRWEEANRILNNDIIPSRDTANTNQLTLTPLVTEYTAAGTTQDRKLEIMNEVYQLPLTSVAKLQNAQNNWPQVYD
jgi:hypothetical protein